MDRVDDVLPEVLAVQQANEEEVPVLLLHGGAGSSQQMGLAGAVLTDHCDTERTATLTRLLERIEHGRQRVGTLPFDVRHRRQPYIVTSRRPIEAQGADHTTLGLVHPRRLRPVEWTAGACPHRRRG